MADLDALLASSSGRRLAPIPDGRLRCTLTGHVLPRRADAVAAYLGGAKFARRAAAADALDALVAAEPCLVPSKNFEGKLYCTLTCHLVNAHPAAVARHVGGTKLKVAKARAAKGELEPTPEPDLPDEEKEGEEEEQGKAGEGGEEEEGEKGVAAAADDAPAAKKRAARAARPKRARRAEA